MFDEIDAVFNIAGKPIIFAWGDILFNPMNIRVTPALMAHETIHGKRQGMFINKWWACYLDDPKFRLHEEILAHKKEYQTLLETSRNRHERRLLLKQTAKRLANPLYGRLITVVKACEVLR